MPFGAASAMSLVQKTVYSIYPAGRSNTATCLNPWLNPLQRKQFGSVLNASDPSKGPFRTVWIWGMEAHISTVFSNLQGKYLAGMGILPP